MQIKLAYVYIYIHVHTYTHVRTCILIHSMLEVDVLYFILPAYRTDLAQVTHTARQIALYLASDEL